MVQTIARMGNDEMEEEKNTYIHSNGVVHGPPAPAAMFAWPDWLTAAPLPPAVETVASEDCQIPAGLPFSDKPAAELPAVDSWEWFDHIAEADRSYLLGPRPEWRRDACPWCHRRTAHTPACDELHDSWSMPMPWGKHKGALVRHLPADYLRWLLTRASIDSDLREEVARVLGVDVSTAA